VNLTDSAGIRGARVSQIYRGHPADVAGLKADDVITRIDKATISSVADAAAAVEALAVAATVDVEVARGGETLVLRVTVGERPSAAAL
jgi:S1-C subfamily serine protease